MNGVVKTLLVFAALVLLCSTAAAQQHERTATSQGNESPLVKLLESKGILTQEEAAMISSAATPAESEIRLAKLLLAKGVISQQDFDRTVGEAWGTAEARVVPASATVTAATTPGITAAQPASGASAGGTGGGAGTASTSQAKEAKVIPAIAPLRLLPITPPKKDGVLPALNLGSGVRLQPYGFFKASTVEQTTSSGGAIFGSNDFPQGPLLLSDTGPDGDPQFHIKDRALRLGVNFEWPDAAKNLTLTGKLEFDFEGNFTDVNNRNISAIRSSQPSLRLAWVRIDTKLGDVPVFFQFGQDWSIFGSSTLMDIFETTGFGFAQGNLYERMPMFRTGFQLHTGSLKIQPEFAIALPIFGEAGLSVDQRLRFGARVGSESNQPELQSRLVFDFPLSHAPGVPTAEIIFSYDHAVASEIVAAGDLPAGAIRSAFPTGLRLNTTRNAWSAEAQLPTPFFTLAAKYYRGGDLRFYFQGQFNDVFSDLGGAHAIPGGTALTLAGRTITFGTIGGQVVAPTLQPVMGQGGFIQLGLPLSRIFGANPEGRQAGWTTYFTYGVDSAFAKDAVRANGLLRTDHASFQLRYKFNKWVSFINETTYIDTRTVGGVRKLFRGVPAHTAHAWRNEFGPLFTF